MVSYALTGGPRPYTLGYALPAGPEAAPGPATPHAVAWPPATLLGYDLAEAALTPGGFVEATLFFQAVQAAPTEQWFRLSLVNTDEPDALIATDQADPCRGIYPAWLWQPGDGICLEPMEYPDAPNHLAFPVRWWLPGDVVRGSIVYRFTGP